RIRTHVLLHHHHVLHQHLAAAGKHTQYAALFALVAPGDYLHRVIPLDVNSYMHFEPSPADHFHPLFSISLTAPQAPEKQSSKTSSRAAHALPDQTRAFRAARRYHRSTPRHSGQSEYMSRHGGDAPCAGARSRTSPPSLSSPGHPALLLSLRRSPHRPG